jgi:hypothetical protein
MKQLHIRWTALSLTLAGTLAVAGCPASDSPSNSDGGATSDGGSTADGAGGTGGNQGGANQGGDGGSGGDSLCEIDCSSIQTPDCNVAICNEGQAQGTIGQCVVVASEDGISCDDGQFCTVNDACSAGECVGGPQNDCGMAPGDCDEVVCDEMSQGCSTTPLVNGTECINSVDLCQVGAACQNGLCIGTTNDCFFQPVPNECFNSVCNPTNGVCEPVPGNDSAACVNSMDLCDINNTCLGGQCQGGNQTDCSFLTQGCDLGICDSATGVCGVQAVMNGQMCDDLSACTTGEICTTGMCGGGTPVTNCEQVGDGCCPTICNDTNDIDCTVQPSCLAIKTSVPASTSGIYVVDPDLSGPIPQTNVYCDMNDDLGGWTLIARFANQDPANWMLDTGEWWYTRNQETGTTTSRSDNADMISRAFWTVQGTELRFSRTDNANDAGLFVSNSGCVPNTNFRSFITAFGNFQNGAIWGADSVAGTCPGVFGNNFAATNGFQQASCTGDIGAPNSISFWSDWSAGDGAVIMIGGGGNSCSRADHGIGVTEANAASFTFSVSSEDDFGSNGSDSSSNDPYALNLWIR